MRRFLFCLASTLLLALPCSGQDYDALMQKGDKALMYTMTEEMIGFYREAVSVAKEVYGEDSAESFRARCRLLWGALEDGDRKLLPFCRATLEDVRDLANRVPADDALRQGMIAYAEALMAFPDVDIPRAYENAGKAYRLLRPIKSQDADLYAMVCQFYGQCEDLTRKDRSALSTLEDGLNTLPATDTELRQILAASMYNNLGTSYSKLHNPGKADAAHRCAEEIFKKYFPVTNELYLSFLNNQIALDLKMGNIKEARKKCTRVFQGIQRGRGRSSYLYGYSSYFKAMIYKAEGRIPDAISTFREVDKSLYDNGWIVNDVRAAALRELSGLLSIQGDVAEAGRVLDEATQINKKLLGNMSELADLEDRNEEANLAVLSGNHEKALSIFSDLVQKAEANPEVQPVTMGQLYGNLAVALKNLKYYQEALTYGRKALAVLRTAPGGERHFRNQAINHIELCRTLGLTEESERLRREAFQIEDNSVEGQLFQALNILQLSEEASDAGDEVRALDLAKKAVEIYERSGAIYTSKYLDALFFAAVDALLAGKRDEISPLTQKYFDTIRQTIRYQFAVMTEAERQRYWDEKDIQFQTMMTLCIYAEDERAGTQLYDAVLLRKGLLSLSSVDMERTLTRSGDKRLQEDFSELRRLRGIMLSSPGQTDAAERAIAIESSLMSRVSSYADFLNDLTMGWQDVQSRLAPDEIAVEFVWNKALPSMSIMGAVVLKRGWMHPEFIPLALDDEDFIGMLIGLRNNRDVRRAVLTGPDGLFDVLWNPLMPFMDGVARIYFSPDETLHSLPLEYLFMPDGKPICDRYRMERLSSTKELARKADPQGRGCALFGGLDYDLSPDEMEYYAGLDIRSEAGEGWAYLPGSMREIKQIHELLTSVGVSVSSRSGVEGVEESFKAMDGASPGIIHVATHGFYRKGDQPVLQRCGLVFAGANNAAEGDIPEDVDDGLLTGAEIACMDLKGCRLAVLSACDTGLGDVEGEGFSGLAQAFKRAGVERLVLSLWSVDDQFTQEFMTAFYRDLINTSDIAEAFSSARTEMSRRYPSPDMWTSFVLLR